MLSFSKTILFRGVWTRNVMNNSFSEEILLERMIEVLTTTITLKDAKISRKLSDQESMKGNEDGINFSFISHWKNPSEPSTCINEANIVTKTINGNSRKGTPYITMNDF
jgi:hypothetical protein